MIPSHSHKELTTADHHVEETWVVLIVLAVNVGSLQDVFYLFLAEQATISKAMLMSLLVEGHDKDIAWLKVGVLQCQHSLQWITFSYALCMVVVAVNRHYHFLIPQ